MPRKPLLSEGRPDLAAEYIDPERPAGSITLGASYAGLWRCAECGHEWRATVASRVRGRGCPSCAGHAAPGEMHLPKEGESFADRSPELVGEWADEKSPYSVSSGTKYKARWRCDSGHEWRASILSRVQGRGCPVCAGKVVLPGYNDLGTISPQLAEEWDDERDVQTVSQFSNYRASWKCKACDYQWTALVSSRHERGCPACAGKVVIPGRNDLATTHPELAPEWNDEADITAFSYGSRHRAEWKCEKGHEWDTVIADRTQYKTGCPDCAARQFVSSGEREIVEYLRQFFPEDAIQTSVRSFRKHGIGELDIYLPEKNIAIEVNGVYWHSEAAGKDASYHLKKYEACQALDIRLIQVWEDDWLHRRDIVKRMLAHKLGVSQEPVIAARKTKADTISTDEARAFLDANHIQGWVRGSLYLGLRYGEELVAVMVLTYSKTETRLERYATSARVPGGQSKLLAYAERTRPWTRLVTFADHEVSDGNLYERTGWTAEKVLRPDYRYVVGGRRAHKFGYRLARFRSDPNLEYVDGLSERELAALNKLHRVWDSGKTRYVKTA